MLGYVEAETRIEESFQPRTVDMTRDRHLKEKETGTLGTEASVCFCAPHERGQRIVGKIVTLVVQN